ncbi:MAG TPA: deoxyribodipyrimidine photo-lyase [Nitrospirae bacterium]|nr:deoxyribodipyrimidine photo-lyase [Nitrospirota bacterium]
MINQGRIRLLKEGVEKKGPVIYWMSRDQRVEYNWALLFAYLQSIQRNTSLIVIFCLVKDFLNASKRAYYFMLEGLKEVEEELNERNIDFVLSTGNPPETIVSFINTIKASILVTDFDPLKIKRQWKMKVKEEIKIPFYEVDTHNIVPCWIASQKQEYGAYTIRKKINRYLKSHLDSFAPIKKMHNKRIYDRNIHWESLYDKLGITKEKVFFRPGLKKAKNVLKEFIENKISFYNLYRNDPSQNFQSNLSPYIHFGQISTQYIAMTIMSKNTINEGVNAFLEELIIRKELSDNFCFYNDEYDTIKGLPKWGLNTLIKHSKDKREYVYNEETFENGQTHDDLWNSAQKELVLKGKMHGFMRMYWAKKILQWTESPEDAIKIAIKLNDKYSLDGRDSKGYTGILWSIGGLHDRAFQERPIFGKVRYMSHEGCKKKFDVKGYILQSMKETKF